MKRLWVGPVLVTLFCIASLLAIFILGTLLISPLPNFETPYMKLGLCGFSAAIVLGVLIFLYDIWCWYLEDWRRDVR